MLREKLLRNKKIVFGILLSVIIISSIIFSTNMKATASDSSSSRYKYFKSIEIANGQTLWSIAKDYISEEYNTMGEYIQELKDMNGLTSDEIHAGQNLVVTYYEEELK